MTMTSRVAVVEDSDADFDALCRALSAVDAGEGVLRFRSGEEVLAFLAAARERNDYPAVILLDLNLPGQRGLEVLATIRADFAIHSLPIMIVSGSARQEDVDAAYAAGANAYIVKPLDYSSLQRAMLALQRFLQVIALPSPPTRSADAAR